MFYRLTISDVTITAQTIRNKKTKIAIKENEYYSEKQVT